MALGSPSHRGSGRQSSNRCSGGAGDVEGPERRFLEAESQELCVASLGVPRELSLALGDGKGRAVRWGIRPEGRGTVLGVWPVYSM